ncbi:MAG: hypothetical protein OXI46_03595 [Gemmatimonadota bacterium]|nr:hypothetical protein [Gemmatimonadota bacterium]
MIGTRETAGGLRRCGVPAALPLAFSLCLAFPGSVTGQGRWYVAMDLGPSLVPEAALAAQDNDWSTKCDLISNPGRIETDNTCSVQPPPAMWENEVAGGTGVSAALAFGYGWRSLRFEGEYLHRTATYGEGTPVRIGDVVTLAKADQELEAVDSRIDGLIGHHFFANAYVDLSPGSNYSPYLGLGAGLAAVSLDYFNRWKRNDDPDLIATFDDSAMKARIAGTTSIAAGRKSDVVFGYQALAGVDRRLGESVTLGIKLRWTMLAEFGDEDEYIQLRSHESSVGRGEAIVYRLAAADLSAFGAAFSLRYGL